MSEFRSSLPPQQATEEQTRRWLVQQFKDLELSLASAGAGPIADAYTVSNYTETRTLDASTATLADLLDVFCTLIYDLQRRGVKRGTYDG